MERDAWELARRVVTKFRGSRDRRVHWVLGELGFASIAFEGSKRLAVGKDTLGHLLYFRLLAEIAIRFSWAGRYSADAQRSQGRIDALMKRDLMTFQKAVQKTGGGSNADAAALLADLEAVNPATPKLEDLAGEADAGGEYRYYRLASSMVHAGAGMRLLGQYPVDVGTLGKARESMIVCLAEANALLRVLGLGPTPEGELDRLLENDIFAISPTVWTVRLRRALARSEGSRGVWASVDHVEMRETDAGLTLSSAATVTGASGRATVVEGIGVDYSSAFAALLAAATRVR